MMITKIYRLLILLLLPLSVDAVGFREIVTDSFLGEPLSARVGLVSVDTEELDSLKASLATAEEFTKAGVARPATLSKLRFQVVAEGTGRASLVITTQESVREPFLNFIIALEWQGSRVLREYSLLLDPPSYRPLASPAALL